MGIGNCLDLIVIACLFFLAGCYDTGRVPSDSDGEGLEEECSPPLVFCGEACVDINHDSGNCGGCGVVCPILTACRGAVCLRICDDPCLGTRTCCDGECVYLSSDRNNCGACGKHCQILEHCSEGVCKSNF